VVRERDGVAPELSPQVQPQQPGAIGAGHQGVFQKSLGNHCSTILNKQS
jgi:hypothetical protein